MATFITANFKKSDDQTNIDNYRTAATITEYHIISKLIFRRLIIPKFMKIRQLFYVKKYIYKCQKSTCLNWSKIVIIELKWTY